MATTLTPAGPDRSVSAAISGSATAITWLPISDRICPPQYQYQRKSRSVRSSRATRMPAPPELTLAQDLANTIDIEEGTEQLGAPADFAAFAAAHGLPDLVFGRLDLARCLAFQEALRDACQAHAGIHLPSSSARVLADALARAPMTLAIDHTGTATVTAAPGLHGADALIAGIAAVITTAVANHAWQRLKACDADGCRWVYYDHSPAGARQVVHHADLRKPRQDTQLPTAPDRTVVHPTGPPTASPTLHKRAAAAPVARHGNAGLRFAASP